MNKAPTTLAEAQDVIRSMHSALLQFRNPEFDLVKLGCEGTFDDRVKGVLSLSAPQILADRAALECGALPPHQQRVLDEKQDLDLRIARLDEFQRRSSVFPTLPDDERARLARQLDVMHELSVILGESIANF